MTPTEGAILRFLKRHLAGIARIAGEEGSPPAVLIRYGTHEVLRTSIETLPMESDSALPTRCGRDALCTSSRGHTGPHTYSEENS